jgi:hypothetical protein
MEKSLASMNKNNSPGQIHHSLRPFLLLCQQNTAGRVARELWWKNQEFHFVDIIPPCFSMLIDQLGDE